METVCHTVVAKDRFCKSYRLFIGITAGNVDAIARPPHRKPSVYRHSPVAGRHPPNRPCQASHWHLVWSCPQGTTQQGAGWRLQMVAAMQARTARKQKAGRV